MARQFVVLIALGCTAVLCTLAGSAFANWITVIDHRPVAIGVPAGATTRHARPCRAASAPARGSDVPGREPAVDLYGNEVTDAVAKYRLDSRGALYEEHSPQTEVPRLNGSQRAERPQPFQR